MWRGRRRGRREALGGLGDRGGGPDPGRDVVGPHRAGEQEALGLVAARAGQRVGDLVGLDALADGPQAEPVGDLDDRA